jgi:hypothetical protein
MANVQTAPPQLIISSFKEQGAKSYHLNHGNQLRHGNLQFSSTQIVASNLLQSPSFSSWLFYLHCPVCSFTGGVSGV